MFYYTHLFSIDFLVKRGRGSPASLNLYLWTYETEAPALKHLKCAHKVQKRPTFDFWNILSTSKKMPIPVKSHHQLIYHTFFLPPWISVSSYFRSCHCDINIPSFWRNVGSWCCKWFFIMLYILLSDFRWPLFVHMLYTVYKNSSHH